MWTGKKLVALVVLVLLGIAGATGLYLYKPWQGMGGEEAESSSDGPFELVDLVNRDFDGSPALALTFTQPLNPRHDYNEYIQVFEMPARAGDPVPRASDEDDDGGYRRYQNSNQADESAQASTAEADVSTEGGQLVKGSWIVGENPRLLFFPHVKPDTRYVVRIAHGVPALSDKKLAAEQRYGIRTASVSPAYYFASKGMVLPAKQNGGLPVVTVNVPEVDIQFLRVKTDQLPRFLDKVISGAAARDTSDEDDEERYYYGGNTQLKGAISNWDLDRIHKLTESVYAGRFLTEQTKNRRNVTFIPVEDIKELREPGVYIAVMSEPNRFRYEYQVTYFYVSNLGLHARLFERGADAFVNSLDNGTAMSGVEVSWIDAQGKVMAYEKTDSDGRAHFAERPAAAKVIMARKDQQVSVIALKEPALDLSEFEISGLPGRAISLFAYSGRNLYRPGETFDVSVLIRDADGQSVPNQPIQAILKRPDGKSQFTATWQPNGEFSGYYQRRLELPADAPTGFWTLELRSDPAEKRPSTTYRFGVEEFLPERMKLELSTASPVLDSEHPFDLKVQGTYLYGAPAAGNRLLGVVQYERQKNPLSQKLPGFEFGDVGEDSARSRVELDEKLLDDNGKAEISISLDPVEKRVSPFTVRATMSLLESGGRPVVRSIDRTFWPASTLVGVRPLFVGAYAQEGSLAQFEVVLADREAKLKAATLPARLFRENRDYYWRFDDQRGWNSGYTETDELVATTNVVIPDAGRGKLSVPVKYGRYRLEITDPETGKSLKYRFYAGWSAKADESQGVRPDRVTLKLDKPSYREGDTAKLTITPPHGGEVLVAVEADQTLWVKRTSISRDGTTIDIPVKKEWRRHDLYVSVLVLRPGSEGDRVTPARALGLLHLPLERGDRKLEVGLDAPKKMLPETPLKVKVKVPGAKGQKAMVTLSAVDVGILNITNFVTPDPHAHFFGRLRYGADLYDIYGRLIEKMPGQRGRLKFGGDAAPKATKSLPKKVRLVDLFSGPVALNDQGEAEVSLTVPDFNGTLRLMAVVSSPDKFGNAEAEVTVAAPLVAELATPRFLTVGDSAIVALDLHNLSGANQDLLVDVESPSGLRIQDGQRKVTIKDQQKVTLRFPVEAGTAFGLVPVEVKVTGGSIKLTREFALQVQAATPQQRVLRAYAIQPGESLDLKDAELGGLLRNTVEAHLTISDKPPIDVRSAIQGLLGYPYGCVEQTTSTSYPHLFIDEAGAKRFGLKPYSRAQRVEMLDKSVARLGAMQAPNGGFSLWGNVSSYEYWLSAYVTNFLVDSQEQGFDVPAQMKQKASDFLLKGLQEGVAGLPAGKLVYNSDSIWRDFHYGGSGRFGVLAYGGYVLARESKAPVATLRQMFDLREQAHSGLALVHLGLALKLMGDDKRGDVAIAEGVKKPRFNDSWWGDYGSTLRDSALSYVLLTRHKVKAEGQENLLATIASEMEKKRYTSTQEKMALFLIGQEMMTNESGAPWTLAVSGKGGDETIKTVGTSVRAVDVSELSEGMRLTNQGKEKLYLGLSMGGFPAKMPAVRQDVVELSRELFDAQGKPLGGRTLHVGETVLVKLTVKPRVNIANALIVDRIPAGLEVENLNIVQGENMNSVQIAGEDPAAAMQDSRIQHVEYRDDRFVAAVRISSNNPIKLFYRTRVVTPGKFVFPPLYAEDMYRPDIYGLVGGDSSITVVDSGPK